MKTNAKIKSIRAQAIPGMENYYVDITLWCQCTKEQVEDLRRGLAPTSKVIIEEINAYGIKMEMVFDAN